MHVRVVCRW